MEYLGQQLVHFHVRPKRAAYLVRPGSTQDFRRAVTHASSRWGGIQELIVPVSRRGRVQPAWLQLLDIMEPDVLFHVAALDEDAKSAVHRATRLMPVDIAHEKHPVWGAHRGIVYPESTGQGVAIHRAARPSVTDVAATGDLADWDPPTDFDARGVPLIDTADRVRLAGAQLSGVTIIGATSRACSEVTTTGLMAGPALIWIARPSSLRDAMWFWNLRALMPLSLGRAPAVLINEEATRDGVFAETLRNVVAGKEMDTQPDAFIASVSLDLDELDRCRLALGFALPPDTKLNVRFGSRRSELKEVTALVGADPRRFLLGNRTSGAQTSQLTTLTRPETTFRFSSPVSFNPGVGGHVRIGISGPAVLLGPPRARVAQLFHDNAEWNRGRIELEAPPDRLYQLVLRLPGQGDLLTAALSDAGISWELSPPGRLAEGMQRLVGRNAQALFADARVLQVVRSLTTRRSRSLARQLADQQITDAAATAVSEALSRVRLIERDLGSIASMSGLPMSDCADVLRDLIAKEMVARGLVLECDTCGLQSFERLEAHEPVPRCGGCSATARYRTGNQGEPALHYRLNALLDRASDQGVLPHLYGAARLSGLYPDAFVVLGANLTSTSDGLLGEADILGVAGSEVLCGEAKSQAADFTERQLRRDAELSTRVGADAHVLVCLQPLPQATADAAARACEQRGLRLILLADVRDEETGSS